MVSNVGIGILRLGSVGLGGVVGVEFLFLGLSGILVSGSHLENQLHVVARAAAADPPVEVARRRRGYEVVVLAGVKFETSWCWSKRSERDREVHEVIGPVAHSNDSWVLLADPARLELLL